MDNLPTDGLLAPSLACVCLALFSTVAPVSSDTNHMVSNLNTLHLSPMGRVAQMFASNPVVPSGEIDAPPVHKGEITLAIDTSGSHIVAGFNDPRGFALSAVSTDGFTYSDDAGKTFTDGGELPAPKGVALLGHPQVRYMGGRNFIYVSLMVRKLQDGHTEQTLCLFRSEDFGHSWDGPYDVTPATEAAENGEAADAEFVAVEPESDRVLVTWTSYGNPSVDESPTLICASYCNDALAAPSPVWSPRAILNPESDSLDSGAMPQFGRDGRCYAAWSESRPGTNLTNIAVAVSADNGVTWTRPRSVGPTPFYGMAAVPGCDSSNSFPSIAVDRSGGPRDGAVYVAYAENTSGDGSDIVLRRSLDGGATFSQPISLSPGQNGGTQFFPFISVDTTNGSLHVAYYDQSDSSSGKFTTVLQTTSEDGGESWSSPTPLGARAFNAATDSNASEPNMGEYNEIAIVDGVTAGMVPNFPVSPVWDEYEARGRSALMDFSFSEAKNSDIPLRLETVKATTASGGDTIEPGDTVRIGLTFLQFASNVRMSPRVLSSIHGELSTTTPGVTITNGRANFADVAAGGTSMSDHPFEIEVSHDYDPNVPIDLSVALNAAQGDCIASFSLHVGQVSSQPVFRADFSVATPNALPQGWSDVARLGAAAAPWTLKTDSSGTGYLYHSFTPTSATENEEIISPPISFPEKQGEAAIDFDLTYDIQGLTENAAGCALRIMDSDDPARSELVQSVAEEFKSTDGNGHVLEGYPGRLPESADPQYMQNTAVWTGVSPGIVHVHITVPNIQGKRVRLAWEYSQLPSKAGEAAMKPEAPTGIAMANLVVSYETREVIPEEEDFGAKSVTYTLCQGGYLRSSLQDLVQKLSGPCALDTFSTEMAPVHGRLYLHDDGLFMYEPDPSFSGIDHFRYSFTDSVGRTTEALVNLLVNPVLKEFQCPSKVGPGQAITGSLLLSGYAPGNGLSVNLTSSNPEVMSVPATVRFQAAAKRVIFPIQCGYSAVTTHVVLRAELNGLKKAVEVTLLSPTFPSASDHSFTAYENERFETNAGCLLSGGFFRADDAPRTSLVEGPSHGSIDVLADGGFAYRPHIGFYGVDSFRYRAIQGGKESAPATVHLRVLPTLHSLEVDPGKVLANNGSVAELNLTGNTPDTGECVQFGSNRPDLISVQRAIQIPGNVSHFAVRFETGPAQVPTSVTLVATIHDTSRSVTFTIVPEQPISAGDFLFRVNENEMLRQSSPGLLQGGFDPNPGAERRKLQFRAEEVNGPTHGAVIVQEDGSFEYTPDIDFMGEDSFSYCILNGDLRSEPRVVRVWVEPTINQFRCGGAEIESGKDFQATVTLAGNAAEEPLRINIDSSRPDLVNGPASVTIRQGERSATLTLHSRPVSSATTLYVTAELNRVEQEFMVILRPSK